MFSSSYDFIYKIYNILLNHNIKCSFFEIDKKPSKIDNRIIVKKHKHYGLSIAHNATIKAIRWIWYDDAKIAMPRKQIIAKKIIMNLNK